MRALLLTFIVLYSGNSYSCLGMVDGRPEWVQLKFVFVLAFLSLLLFLSIFTTFLNWKEFWKIPLVSYGLLTMWFYLHSPIQIIDPSCSILKEQIAHSFLIYGIIIFILEIKTILNWLQNRNGITKNT